MKKHTFNLAVVPAFLMYIILGSCGGGGVKSNEYLGELPGIANKYYYDSEGKEEAADKATNMDKAYKYAKEAKNLEDKGEEKVTEAFENGSFNSLPFENMEESDYLVKDVVISRANGLQSLPIKFTVEAKKDIVSKYGNPKGQDFIYYIAMDNEGNDIADSKTVAMSKSVKGGIKKGMELEMNGNLKPLYDLQDFGKIKIISKEEYDKK